MSRAIKAGEAYVELGVRSQIEKGLRGFGSKFKAAGAKIGMIGAAMTGAATAALAAPVKLASDSEEALSKLSAVFGENAEAMQKWGADTGRAMGVTRTQMNQMTGAMQDLLVPMGIGTDEATDMTKELSKLAIDLSSFNNMDSAKTFEDMMSAMTGSSEVLKKYGVMVNQAAIEQEAYNLGIAEQGAKLNAVQKAQATYSLILKGTTAAQGDAIRTADGFANQVRRLWTNLKELGTELGRAVLPVLTRVLQVANKVARRFFDWAMANQHVVQWLGKGLLIFGSVGVSLGIIGAAAGAAGFFMTGLATAIGAVGAIATTVFSPIVAAGIAIAAVFAGVVGVFIWAAYQTGLLGAAFEKLQEFMAETLEVAKTTFGGISDAMAIGDWEMALKIGMTGLELIVRKGMLAIYEAVIELWPLIEKTLIKATEKLAGWVWKMKDVIQNPTKLLSASGFAIYDVLSGGIGDAGFGDSLQGGIDENQARLDALRKEAADRRAELEGGAPGSAVGPSRDLLLEAIEGVRKNTAGILENSDKVPVAKFG